MYKLKVEWCGFKPGEEIYSFDAANCYACKNKQGESIWVSTKQDLPTLIEHGIIEEITNDKELKWTDADMIEFYQYSLRSPIFSNHKTAFEMFKNHKEIK